MSDKRSIFVFDPVRSNSQLFNKLFATHPQLEQIFMPLIGAALFGPEGVFRGRQHGEDTEEAFNSLAEPSGAADGETFAVATERIYGAVAGVLEKGKIPWLKDHNFCAIPRNVQDSWIAGDPLSDALCRNPTVFSTEFLNSLTPIFLVRHPALSIPSFLRKDRSLCKNRADDEDFAIYVAHYWSRLIFESFILRSGGSVPPKVGEDVPIVVDAADVIYNSEATIDALCGRLGIEASGVQYTWPPVPENERPTSPTMRHFFDDLFNSSGIERRADKPSELSIDIEALERAWVEEFGPDNARGLRKLVDQEIPHYEYLMNFKLRV